MLSHVIASFSDPNPSASFTSKGLLNNDIIAFDIEEADWTAGKGTGQYPSDSTWAASKTQIVSQSMDYGLITPILTAALKEAIAKIETLETKVQALEDA